MIEKIKGILANQLEVEVDEITEESKLQEDLGADSLDVVEIVMALEDEFNIEIPDSATANMKTVKDIVDFIEAQ